MPRSRHIYTSPDDWCFERQGNAVRISRGDEKLTINADALAGYVANMKRVEIIDSLDRCEDDLIDRVHHLLRLLPVGEAR